jgi:hypothetical protein
VDYRKNNEILAKVKGAVFSTLRWAIIMQNMITSQIPKNYIKMPTTNNIVLKRNQAASSRSKEAILIKSMTKSKIDTICPCFLKNFTML